MKLIVKCCILLVLMINAHALPTSSGLSAGSSLDANMLDPADKPRGVGVGYDEGIPLLSVSIKSQDKTSLQRGAKMFVNYCAGCHSLQYMRYSRMGEDIGLVNYKGELDEALLTQNLMFTQADIHDAILNAMPKNDAKGWFGNTPPDLSLVARARGPAWIYTYLKSFYADESRPFGANNLLFKEVAMPNVLGPLSGKVILSPNLAPSMQALVLIENGQMTPQQFDSALVDLVTFLDYVSEPNKWERHRMGVFVLIFLGVLWILAFKLKQSYWQKIRKNPPKETDL